MTEFAGVAIHEEWVYSELVLVWIVFFVGVVLFLSPFVRLIWEKTAPRREAKRIKQLSERSDKESRRELRRATRVRLRKPKAKKKGAFPFDKVLIGAFGLFIAAYCGVGLALSYIDLAKKDYVVYTGEFTYEHKRVWWSIHYQRVITLDDGTELTGVPIYDDGSGTIVYTKRSKTVIGYELDQ